MPAATIDRAAAEVAAEGVLRTIGNTPLVPLHRWRAHAGGPLIHLKLESANPGGSAKDRPAAAIVSDALAEGALEPGGCVIESSSGNMGIGLAQACCYFGLRFICVVDRRSSGKKVATMRAFGAEVEVVTDAGPDGDLLTRRLERVAELCRSIPGAWWPNQYENPSNPASHQRGTAREIFEELEVEPDFLFVATSTTGTLAGCERHLRSIGARTELVAVDATGSALFGGERGERLLPGLGAGVETAISADVAPDRIMRIDERGCVLSCRRLVRREAILAGASTGAVLSAIEATAPDIDAGATVAAISPDGGAGYLDTVYNDDWVHRNLGLAPEALAGLTAG